jgi:hypothetical protein
VPSWPSSGGRTRNPDPRLDGGGSSASASSRAVVCWGLRRSRLGEEVGKFQSVYGVKLHLLCATNRVPLSYEEESAANVAEGSLTEEFLAEAGLGKAVARKH